MKRHDFLKRVYEGGIAKTKGREKKALSNARHCFLLADDLAATRPDASVTMARKGLAHLKAIRHLDKLEGYNLLFGALEALAK